MSCAAQLHLFCRRPAVPTPCTACSLCAIHCCYIHPRFPAMLLLLNEQQKKNLFWEEAAHRKETLSGWSSNRDRARLFWQARWDHPPHVNRVEYANLKLASRLYQKETKEAKTINYSRPPPTIFVCVCVNRQSLLQHRMLHELFMNISIGKDKWALTILKEEKSPVIVPLKK